ncbi:MAG: hypothetical protein ACRDKY_04570 [Solirubrobacteraceae bacterium]
MPAAGPHKRFEAAVAGGWLTAAIVVEMARRDRQARLDLRERPGTAQPLLDVLGAAADLVYVCEEAVAMQVQPRGRKGTRRSRRRG